MSDIESRIDQLLHDVEHKRAGADFARMMGDIRYYHSAMNEADAMLSEANRLDPEHKCAAWSEADV